MRARSTTPFTRCVKAADSEVDGHLRPAGERVLAEDVVRHEVSKGNVEALDVERCDPADAEPGDRLRTGALVAGEECGAERRPFQQDDAEAFAAVPTVATHLRRRARQHDNGGLRIEAHQVGVGRTLDKPHGWRAHLRSSRRP